MRALYLSSRNGASRGLDTEINLVTRQMGWNCTTYRSSLNIEKMQDIIDKVHFSDVLIVDFLSPSPFAFQVAGVAQGLGKTVVIIVDADKPFPQPFAYRYSTVIIIDRYSNASFLKSSIQAALTSSKRLVKEIEESNDLIYINLERLGTKAYNEIVKEYLSNELGLHKIVPHDKRIKFSTYFGSFKGVYQNPTTRALVFSSYRNITPGDAEVKNFQQDLDNALKHSVRIDKIFIFTITPNYDLIEFMASRAARDVEVIVVKPSDLNNFVLKDIFLREKYATAIDFNTALRRINDRLQILAREEAKTSIQSDITTHSIGNEIQEDTWHTISLAVAHKIGNPINTLSTDSKLLLKELSKLEKSDRLPRIAERMRSTALHAQIILNQFKTASSAFSISVSSYEIYGVAEKIQSKYQNEVKITCIAESEGKAIFDYNKLLECFDELISNSKKCNNENVEVNVKISLDENNLNIIYEDNGVGIPEDKKEEIFELWSSFRENGQGIGMWTVRRIISSHGGSIKENGTNGARFVIQLPIYGVN